MCWAVIHIERKNSSHKIILKIRLFARRIEKKLIFVFCGNGTKFVGCLWSQEIFWVFVYLKYIYLNIIFIFPVINDHPKLDTSQVESLLKPMSKEEVYATVKFMKPYKAPSLCGFQPIFYQKYWHVASDVNI